MNALAPRSSISRHLQLLQPSFGPLACPPHSIIYLFIQIHSIAWKMFNSLKEQDSYNELLLFSVCILMSSNISLCVFHIPGMDNSIADTLSQHLPRSEAHLLPVLQIHHFQTPHIALGHMEWWLSPQKNTGSHYTLPSHVSSSSVNMQSLSVSHWTIPLYKHISPTCNPTSRSANFTC